MLSNEFGQTPLVIDTATVSGAQGGPPRTTTLRGSARWEVPPGQTAASDPVQLPVAAGEEIAVTCYVSGTADPAAFLHSAQLTGYAAPGNQAARDQLPAPTAHWWENPQVSRRFSRLGVRMGYDAQSLPPV